MTTRRQIEANRRNAEKSTGPRTDEGKRIARRNALKHGMAGRGVVLPDEVAVEVNKRMEEWNSSIKPFDPFEVYLFEQLCIESVRIDALNFGLDESRRRQADRAGSQWDDDRALEAEELASGLSRAPTTVSLRLKRTAGGCALMIGRWKALIAILEIGGAWDEDQRSLALDLLATPSALRNGPTRLGPAADRLDREACLATARAEVADLDRRLADGLEQADDEERAAAELGVGLEVSKVEAQARRYLGACRRRLEWARAELRRDRGATRRAPAPTASRDRPFASPEPARPPTTARPIAPSPTTIASGEQILAEMRELAASVHARRMERKRARQEADSVAPTLSAL